MSLYRQDKTTAKAGQIARVGESLSRSTGEPNIGTTDVRVGHFVTFGAEYGCQALTKPDEKVLGVIVQDLLQGTYATDDTPSVGRIGNGDAIWVKASGDFARGDDVFIKTKDGAKDSGIYAGSVVNAAIENETIATTFVVEQVAGGLVMISRKEA